MKLIVLILVFLSGCMVDGYAPVSSIPNNVLCTVATLAEPGESGTLGRVGVDLGTVIIRPAASYTSFEQILKEASAQAALAGGTHYVMVRGEGVAGEVLGEGIMKEYPTATFEVYRVEAVRWVELPVYLKPECRGVFRPKGT